MQQTGVEGGPKKNVGQLESWAKVAVAITKRTLQVLVRCVAC